MHLRKLSARWKRLRRHLYAFRHYNSLKKLCNLVRIEYEYLRRRPQLKGKPYMVVLDPTNYCNLRCRFCPTWRGELPQPKGKISLEDFHTMVDKIHDWTYKLILYNWGEPFLHPQIIELITYAHTHRVATALSTNLNYLPAEGPEALIRSGLDDLIVSLDGLTQETYQRYQEGGNLDQVKENVTRIVEARRQLGAKNPHLELQFLVFRHNEAELPQLSSFSKKLGFDTYRLARPFIPEEHREEFMPSQTKFVLPHYLTSPEKAKQQRTKACFWLWRAMVVNWTGEVDPCCGINTFGSFGNLIRSSLNQIWNNESYVLARKIVRGSSDVPPELAQRLVCFHCPGYPF